MKLLSLSQFYVPKKIDKYGKNRCRKKAYRKVNIANNIATCQTFLPRICYKLNKHLPQGRIKKGQRGQLPHAPRSKEVPRDEHYLFLMKYLFEKLSFRNDARRQIYIPMWH